MHLLIHYPPKVALSNLVSSLIGVSSRRLRQGVHRPRQPGDHARPVLVRVLLRRVMRRCSTDSDQGLHRVPVSGPAEHGRWASTRAMRRRFAPPGSGSRIPSRLKRGDSLRKKRDGSARATRSAILAVRWAGRHLGGPAAAGRRADGGCGRRRTRWSSPVGTSWSPGKRPRRSDRGGPPPGTPERAGWCRSVRVRLVLAGAGVLWTDGAPPPTGGTPRLLARSYRDVQVQPAASLRRGRRRHHRSAGVSAGIDLALALVGGRPRRRAGTERRPQPRGVHAAPRRPVAVLGAFGGTSSPSARCALGGRPGGGAATRCRTPPARWPP